MTVMLAIVFALTTLATSWLAMWISWNRGYKKGCQDGMATCRKTLGRLVENAYAPKQKFLRPTISFGSTPVDPCLASLEVR